MAKGKKSPAKTPAIVAESAPIRQPAAKVLKKSEPNKVQSKKSELMTEKLVTNIVAVEATDTSTPKDGVIKMTKATEKKAEATKEAAVETKTAAVETAKSFFADAKAKATQAAEKSRELVSEAGNITRANLEAVTESGKIAAKGTQELAKENIEYAKTNFSEAQAAVKSLTAVKSPTEFVKVQTEIARKGFDTMVSQGSKNTETMIKLAGDAFQPLSNRMAVAKDFFKKAA